MPLQSTYNASKILKTTSNFEKVPNIIFYKHWFRRLVLLSVFTAVEKSPELMQPRRVRNQIRIVFNLP